MSKADEAVVAARLIAADDSHGYDQNSRWGKDYDCSSFLITVWENVGVPVKSKGATYTGNMKSAFLACGFSDVTKEINLGSGAGLIPGDVLLNERDHTAMYIGSWLVVQAGSNENGGITGGQSGDQTGREIGELPYYNFPWDCVLRYTADDKDKATGSVSDNGVYTVKPGDSLWAIAEKYLGNGALYSKIVKLNKLTDLTIHPGQTLLLREGGRKVEMIVKEQTYTKLLDAANKAGKTIGEIVDGLV